MGVLALALAAFVVWPDAASTARAQTRPSRALAWLRAHLSVRAAAWTDRVVGATRTRHQQAIERSEGCRAHVVGRLAVVTRFGPEASTDGEIHVAVSRGVVDFGSLDPASCHAEGMRLTADDPTMVTCSGAGGADAYVAGLAIRVSVAPGAPFSPSDDPTRRALAVWDHELASARASLDSDATLLLGPPGGGASTDRFLEALREGIVACGGGASEAPSAAH